ncbi:type VI protein secretion system component VasK [Pseudorhizobium tarimense]|uniref:Type VI protein secretion system component VasK n=1 Tax=Pseudorhizobium tarimense TaxID=1079109 RepID=A0ABV2H8P1_9HYPH|nr:hypothetical protein [Pseudorhizobium tarimense]MCJ8520041.1 hypothetical protein [Pseudorhizobium tarimense]
MRATPLLAIISGFVLWSVIFLLLYGVQATGCHLAGDNLSANGEYPWVRLILIAVFVLSFLALGYTFLRARKRKHYAPQADDTGSFVREVSGYIWIAALVATPFTFGGVAWLSLCGT